MDTNPLPWGKPWPKALAPPLQSQGCEMLRVLLALEGWGCHQGVPQQPGAPGVTLPAQLSPCHSPHQSVASPHISGEHRDTALHPRIPPASGAVPGQGTVPKPGHKAKTRAGEVLCLTEAPAAGRWDNGSESQPTTSFNEDSNLVVKPQWQVQHHTAGHGHPQHCSRASESNIGFPNPAESSSDVLLL